MVMVQLPAALIVRPAPMLIDEPPAAAVVAPEPAHVVLGFGLAAYTKPAGNVSTWSVIMAAAVPLALVIVRVSALAVPALTVTE